jgi:hypothetical protein
MIQDTVGARSLPTREETKKKTAKSIFRRLLLVLHFLSHIVGGGDNGSCELNRGTHLNAPSNITLFDISPFVFAIQFGVENAVDTNDRLMEIKSACEGGISSSVFE